MSAFLIARVKIHDPEAYKAYTECSPAIVQSFGGQFIARGGSLETVEGAEFDGRLVIVQFPTRAAAHAFYHSPAYQELIKLRAGAADAEMIIVEGVE